MCVRWKILLMKRGDPQNMVFNNVSKSGFPIIVGTAELSHYVPNFVKIKFLFEVHVTGTVGPEQQQKINVVIKLLPI